MTEKGIKKTEYSYNVKFTWKIDNFSTINKNHLYSDVFIGGDHKWKILIYPKGQSQYADKKLAIYLYVADSATLPIGWNRHVKCSLSVISEVDANTVKIGCENTFNANRSGFGHHSFMDLDKLRRPDQRFLVRDTCLIRAEVSFNEENAKEAPKIALIPVNCSSSLTKFDSLFTNIQNRLHETTTYSNFRDEEIGDAQAIFETCLGMDLKSLVCSGKAPELKSALSLLLTAKAIPDSTVDESTKFLDNFDQQCEKYETAQRDLSEAQEDENSVDELKTNLKQLSSKFMPARKQAEALDVDISRQEKLMAESKAMRVRLGKRLDELGKQATTWDQALLCAEQRMNISKIKKGKAEKAVGEFQVPWESLKALHSVNNRTANNLKTGKTRASPAQQQSRNLRPRIQ